MEKTKFNETMKKWYVIGGYEAHSGKGGFGSHNSTAIYVFTKDAVHALNIYETLPGFKRKTHKGEPFPKICPLTQEESSKLERMIESKGIPVQDARKTWWHHKTLYAEAPIDPSILEKF